MQLQRLSTAWITGRGFAVAIFFVGIAWLLVEPSTADEGLGSGGLVAHWTFEEGSGNAVKDVSGNGNNGIIIPATAPEPRWGTGKFAGSIAFDGGTIVRIPSSESLNSLKRQITVLARIYPRSLWNPPTIYQRAWRKAVHSAERLLGMATNDKEAGFIAVVQRQWREVGHPDLFYLGYGRENNVLLYKWHLGLTDTEVSLYRLPSGQGEPVVGEWVHLAGTYDGETGKMSLYVNGKLIGSQTHAGEIRLDAESLNRPLVIGGELNGSDIDDASNQFNGYVDDVRIYDRALSGEEIAILAEEAGKQVTK